MKTTAIVLSAGSGKRMGAGIPKQYMELGGYPIIYYCLKTFQDSFIDEIVLVCGRDDIDMCRADIVEKYDFTKVRAVVAGGMERYHSVAYGLRACSEDCDYVFIHDGARPFVDEGILTRALESVRKWGSAIAAVPSKDTVKISDADGFAIETPNRDTVWLMQTPQTFDYNAIRACYEKLLANEKSVIAQGVKITDDAMVMEHFGGDRIRLSEGSYRNIKITTPEDIIIGEALVSGGLRWAERNLNYQTE